MNDPLTGSEQVLPFLRRNGVPTHQNLLIRDQAAATATRRGDLELCVGADTGFVFNAAFDPQQIDYGSAYDNNQTYSHVFSSYVDGLVHHLIDERDTRQQTIVEVGCGKGYFLRRLVENPAWQNQGYGFDPTYVGPDEMLDGRLRFVQQFYDETNMIDAVDTIICRHVIEHIPDPVAFLRSIRQTLDHSRRPRLFFETPTVRWIVQHQVFWDFFYEHCSYFTAESLTLAFARAGFAVIDVRHIFGGQYLWLEATTATEESTTTTAPGANTVVDLCQQFHMVEHDLIAQWRNHLAAVAETGRVALWGAGAKGVTVANVIDPQRELITCVVDLNPQKQGCFIPGTGHPIVNYLDLPAHGVQQAVLMNPNYGAENLALLREANVPVTLIDSANWRPLS